MIKLYQSNGVVKHTDFYSFFYIPVAIVYIDHIPEVLEAYIQLPVQPKPEEVIDLDELEPRSNWCQHPTHFVRM